MPGSKIFLSSASLATCPIKRLCEEIRAAPTQELSFRLSTQLLRLIHKEYFISYSLILYVIDTLPVNHHGVRYIHIALIVRIITYSIIGGDLAKHTSHDFKRQAVYDLITRAMNKFMYGVYELTHAFNLSLSVIFTQNAGATYGVNMCDLDLSAPNSVINKLGALISVNENPDIHASSLGAYEALVDGLTQQFDNCDLILSSAIVQCCRVFS
jgi:hypothetical protein